jgi:hypothetical protein
MKSGLCYLDMKTDDNFDELEVNHASEVDKQMLCAIYQKLSRVNYLV